VTAERSDGEAKAFKLVVYDHKEGLLARGSTRTSILMAPPVRLRFGRYVTELLAMRTLAILRKSIWSTGMGSFYAIDFQQVGLHSNV